MWDGSGAPESIFSRILACIESLLELRTSGRERFDPLRRETSVRVHRGSGSQWARLGRRKLKGHSDVCSSNTTPGRTTERGLSVLSRRVIQSSQRRSYKRV